MSIVNEYSYTNENSREWSGRKGALNKMTGSRKLNKLNINNNNYYKA